jgi:hypothetical protein
MVAGLVGASISRVDASSTEEPYLQTTMNLLLQKLERYQKVTAAGFKPRDLVFRALVKQCRFRTFIQVFIAQIVHYKFRTCILMFLKLGSAYKVRRSCHIFHRTYLLKIHQTMVPIETS